MPDFKGVVQIQDASNAPTVVLDGDNGDVTIGGSGQDGQLTATTGAGVTRLTIDGATGSIIISAADGDPVVTVDGNEGDVVIYRKFAGTNREIFRFQASNATLHVGGTSNSGDLVVRDSVNNERIKLDGAEGDIWVKDTAGHMRFQFDASSAELRVGGQSSEGDVIVRDSGNVERIRLDGGAGDIVVKDSAGHPLFHFDSTYAALWVGGQGNEGDVVVRDASNRERIKLDAGEGDIWVKNTTGNLLLHFDSANAGLWVGGSGNEGDVIVRDAGNRQRVKLDGGEGDIWVKDTAGHTLFHFDSAYAALWVGGQGNEGDVVVRDAANKERVKLDAGEGDIWVKDANGHQLFHFDSTYAALYLGGHGNEGDVVVRDAANKERVKLDGGDGDIWVKDASGNLLFHFDSTYAALYLGGQGNEGDLVVRNGDGNQTIKLDGQSGDIILNNADAAEDFDIVDAGQALPGTVMVLAADGRLEPCLQPYDRKVVGVVSGAGSYRPGIVFDRGATPDHRRAPVSVMGKVACRADAGYGSIQVGDLLTTSPSPGCAMRASDPARALGSIIGKALSPLPEGEGLVTMLISLQ